MKNLIQTINKSMLTIIVISLMSSITSCKKEDTQEKLQQQIDQVLPQKFIDTLKNLGLTINNGTTPPDVNGIYICSPMKLKASNIAGDFPVGHTFGDGKLKLQNQNNTTFSIEVLGKNFLAANDTSIVAAISGSGNNFTVFSKVKATNGASYAFFALILSGTINSSGIQNFEYGIVNIDNTHGMGTFMPEGGARLIYDADFTSVTTTVFRMLPVDNNDKRKPSALL